VPRASFVQAETRQLAVLRSGSAAVFRVIYSREMPRFLMYVLEREPHYSLHPVICPFVVCPVRPGQEIPQLSRNTAAVAAAVPRWNERFRRGYTRVRTFSRLRGDPAHITVS